MAYAVNTMKPNTVKLSSTDLNSILTIMITEHMLILAIYCLPDYTLCERIPAGCSYGSGQAVVGRGVQAPTHRAPAAGHGPPFEEDE
jgi:hypothetical protein